MKFHLKPVKAFILTFQLAAGYVEGFFYLGFLLVKIACNLLALSENCQGKKEALPVGASNDVPSYVPSRKNIGDKNLPTSNRRPCGRKFALATIDATLVSWSWLMGFPQRDNMRAKLSLVCIPYAFLKNLTIHAQSACLCY